MKTKNIFKALALAMLMPAMMLTTACSSDDDFVTNNNEQTIKKGFELPVTVNVTRQGDATTRATFNESTKKLEFSAGDKLLVRGNDKSDGGAGYFAGMLDYDASEGKFSGTIYTQNEYSGTADALLTAAASNPNWVGAALFPKGYESYEFLSISSSGYNTSYSMSYNKAIAADKATAVEQFSLETAKTYSSGFTLSPENAILNFTIAGLTDGAKAVTLMNGSKTMFTGSVTPTSGTAAFALGARIKDNSDFPVNLKNVILTIGDADIDITDANNNLAAGKIYNITRSATGTLINLAEVSANTVAQNGDILTGTLGANVKISIADGATVILNNATISYSSNGADYAGLTLLGDGTIVLADGTTNTVVGGLASDGYSNWPGIFVPAGKTLTINGNTGVLNAARGGDDIDDGSPAGIGAGWNNNCGNIVINGGFINATGGGKGAGIGGCGRRGCGNITINGGTVTATGGSGAPGIGLGGTSSSNNADGGTCGDITISGGIIIATGGEGGAGIGTGYSSNAKDVTVTKTCGNILISGGTITATGGNDAAGIGTGKTNDKGIINIGTITITNGVTLVTATKGTGAPNSIGAGGGNGTNTCGTVTIGGVETGNITTSPYTYPEP